jgi:plasmid stabilization system protein ParE
VPEIAFLPPAREEFLAAAAYYESGSPGLGAEFIDDVERAVNRLATFPDHGSPYVAGTRRLVLRRFPFDVVYLHSQDQVVIVAIAHQRRSPYYWRDRI